MGLKGTRQQNATFDTIAPFVQEIRDRFPTMGARQMVTTLRQDYSLKVPEYKTLIIKINVFLISIAGLRSRNT